MPTLGERARAALGTDLDEWGIAKPAKAGAVAQPTAKVQRNWADAGAQLSLVIQKAEGLAVADHANHKSDPCAHA